MDWLGLTNARVLVIGAGAMGAPCVRGLISAGARVVVVDANSQRLQSLRAEPELAAGDLEVIQCELNSSYACDATVRAAADMLDGLDTVIHALGVNDRRPIMQLPDEAWERVITLNLSTAFWCGRAAARLMSASGSGSMVFFSSVSSKLADLEQGHYAAAKGGLNQLMRVLARELAEYGVTVNAIAPGYTETSMNSGFLARPGVRRLLTAMVPAGRLGHPADVVGPALFLASPRASFITGQVLCVDGGRTLV
ncbi:SDR family NAD(P)-dependent oxidoreductase [Nocardia sp. NPDC052001]|uniref:SDR family NAD(P)-dependent oxidoreductase n=1 Tax=Nocardia sp. NPDC052001 TaxID=3154853 RepID=UPI003420C179